MKAPSAVAVERPSLPPSASGLPVTAAGEIRRLIVAVRVDHPAHDEFVRVDVGGRYVELLADEVGGRADVAAAQALQFEAAEFLRIDAHAAPWRRRRAGRGRALEHHPEGERLHLVDDVRVEANAAFRRATGVVVPNAITGEGPKAPIVHPHGYRDLEHGFRQAKSLQRVVGDGRVLERRLEPAGGVLEQGATDARQLQIDRGMPAGRMHAPGGLTHATELCPGHERREESRTHLLRKPSGQTPRYMSPA